MILVQFLLFYFLCNHANATLSKCVCGREGIQKRIMGGLEVESSKYPWMAYVYIKTDRGGSQCGGALINDRYILTAAHCFPKGNESKVVIALGVTDLSKGVVPLEVETIINHENYDAKKIKNDIALVKLKTPVEYNDKIRPICLPPRKMLQFGELTIAGWGRTESGKSSRKLLDTKVTEYEFDKCNAEMGQTLDQKSQFCAGEIGKSSCSGDSGGPVTYKKGWRTFVVGVVSYRVGDCGMARTSVRTRITHYLDWILSNTKDAKYCR